MATTYARLAADDTGGDDRAPIVLLHGLTFDRHIWAPIIDRVRALDPGRRVVAFDLPGHGASAAQPPHDFDHVIALLDDALAAASIERPVLVGHSIAGGIASAYGARHAVSAIVNVDQALDIAPFAELLASIADQLRGPRFDEVWRMFHRSFHTELLDDATRALVESNSHPRQELVLSYWAPLLDGPIDTIVAMIDDATTAIASSGTPYTMVLGAPLPPDAIRSLTKRVPHARVLDWSPSGHFPHLANPSRFAELLCDQHA